jgi:hypothetical protein
MEHLEFEQEEEARRRGRLNNIEVLSEDSDVIRTSMKDKIIPRKYKEFFEDEAE